jgi:DNA-binding response OmpR family regulator
MPLQNFDGGGGRGGHDGPVTNVAARSRPETSWGIAVTRSEKTVLIVDDDGPSRTVLSIVCGSRGHTVIEASSGAEALAAATAMGPDLILLDVDLPDMSGLDVCRRVREAGLATPIMMLSGHADPADVSRGLLLGADEYLTKPFELRDLVARMDERLCWDSFRAA